MPQTRRGKILFIRSGKTLEQTLAMRFLLVLSLLTFVFLAFWLDREGLRDHYDGVISFGDILYFTMITVTTVGYGDIVPVSDSARLIDAFAVTPIRLFVWFIFLGTAYEFVIQKIAEDVRMKNLQKSPKNHVILCGFGHSGFIAAQESVTKGVQPDKIVVIDSRENRIQLAADSGYIGLLGDATSEELLNKASIQTAKSIIISPGRDDAALLITLTARHMAPHAKILVSIKQEENIKLATLSGANTVISPPKMSGYLLANGIDAENATSFLADAMSAGGNVVLKERLATTREIGKTMSQITESVIVNVHAADKNISFAQRNDYVIQEGDCLLVICPVGQGDC